MQVRRARKPGPGEAHSVLIVASGGVAGPISLAAASAHAAHAPAPVVLGFLEEQDLLSAVCPGRRDPADQVVEIPERSARKRRT